MSQTKIKALITGGAGFVGSNLAEFLLNKGFSICILDNLSTGKIQNIDPFINKIEFVEGDVRDFQTVKKISEGCDIIFHYAAMASVNKSMQEPYNCNDINTGGTINILEAARINNIKKIIFASTSAVYGDNPDLPKTENMQLSCLSPYAASKLSSEHYMRMYAGQYGIQTLVFRYFNIYGPKQDPSSPYSGVISIFISKILSGEIPVIYGDGLQSRDFVFINDVCEINYRATVAEIPEKNIIANVATGKSVNLINLVDTINKINNTELKPFFDKPRAGDIIHSLGDNRKLFGILNFKPETSIEAGLKATIGWITNNQLPLGEQRSSHDHRE